MTNRPAITTSSYRSAVALAFVFAQVGNLGHCMLAERRAHPGIEDA